MRDTFIRPTLDDNRASASVPLDILVAVNVVKPEPSTAGNAPVPLSCNSWFAPLKVLPATVTLVLRRASASVPDDIFDALSAVKAAALSVGKLPEPSSCTNWLIPLNVLPSFVTLVVNNESATKPEPLSCNN